MPVYMIPGPVLSAWSQVVMQKFIAFKLKMEVKSATGKCGIPPVYGSLTVRS